MDFIAGGMIVTIDDEDSDLVSSRKPWIGFSGKRTNPYVLVTQGSRSLRLHRLIVSRMLGRPLTRSDIVDHVSRDTLDNRRCNLRIVDYSQSTMNTKKRRSGFRGVYPDGKRWRACLSIKSKTIHVPGRFSSEEDAAVAWDAMATSLYGDYAVLNFPAEKVKP